MESCAIAFSTSLATDRRPLTRSFSARATWISALRTFAVVLSPLNRFQLKLTPADARLLRPGASKNGFVSVVERLHCPTRETVGQ